MLEEPQKVTIKDFTGKKFDDFKSWCETKKLNYLEMYVHDDNVKKGTIISQYPSTGTFGIYNSVSVTVSEGPWNIYPEPSPSPEPTQEPTETLEPSPEPSPEA